MDVLMKKLQRFWILLLAVGLLNILIGFNVFLPFKSHEHLCRLVAVMLLVGSATLIVYNVTIHLGRHMTSGLLLAVIRIVVAGLLLFHPLDTNITFTTLLGIYFGVEGALALGEAHRMKNMPVLWLPTTVVGITGVIFCALIWLLLKGSSYATITALLAVMFWLRGGVQIFTALRFKNYKSPDETAGTQGAPPADEAPPAASEA